MKPNNNMLDLLKVLQTSNLNTMAFNPDRELIDAVKNNQHDKVDQLLKANPNKVDLKDSDGNPLIVIAADCGHLEVFKTIMQYKPDLKQSGPEFGNALQAAAFNALNRLLSISPTRKENCHKIALTLVESNQFDLNVRSKTGQTLLHYAAQSDNQALAETLIAAGADATLMNNDKQRPADFAAKYSWRELASYLRVTTLKKDAQTGIYGFAIDKENGEVEIVLQSDSFKGKYYYALNCAFDAVINQLKATAVNTNLGLASNNTHCTEDAPGQRADTEIPRRSDYVIQEFKGANNAYRGKAILRVIIKPEYRNVQEVYDVLYSALQDNLALPKLPELKLTTEEKVAKKNVAATQLLANRLEFKPSIDNLSIKTRNPAHDNRDAPIYKPTSDFEPFFIDLSRIPCSNDPSGKTLEDWLLALCREHNIRVETYKKKPLAKAQVIVAGLPGVYDPNNNNLSSSAEYVGEWYNNSSRQERYLTLVTTTLAIHDDKPLTNTQFVRFQPYSDDKIQGKLPHQKRGEYTNFKATEISNETALAIANTDNNAFEALQLNGTIMIVAHVKFTPSPSYDHLSTSGLRGTPSGSSATRSKGVGSLPSAYSMVGSGQSENTQRYSTTEEGTYKLDLENISFFLVQPTVINVGEEGLQNDLPRFVDVAELLIKQKYHDTVQALKKRYGTESPRYTFETCMKKVDVEAGKPHNYSMSTSDFLEETLLKIAGITIQPTVCITSDAKCDPWHLAIHIGGLSEEDAKKLVHFYNHKYPDAVEYLADITEFHEGKPTKTFYFNMNTFCECIIPEVRTYLDVTMRWKANPNNNLSYPQSFNTLNLTLQPSTEGLNDKNFIKALQEVTEAKFDKITTENNGKYYMIYFHGALTSHVMIKMNNWCLDAKINATIGMNAIGFVKEHAELFIEKIKLEANAMQRDSAQSKVTYSYSS